MKAEEAFLIIDLGACCACGKLDETVRNLIMLPEMAPVAGTGWGCSVCGLGADGAMAVVCDSCLANNAEIHDVIRGYATDCLRMKRCELVGMHEHDPEKHEAEDRQRAKRILEEYRSAKQRKNGNGHKPQGSQITHYKRRSQRKHR